MNSLKRIFVSIKGQIDHVADEFENHEALAGVAIQDLQVMVTKTRLHLHRVSKLTENYQTQLQEQQQQASLWSERAIKVREEDEQKALQCVQRLRQTQQQIKMLEQQYQQSSAQQMKIKNDLNSIKEQLQIMQNKKEILSARQNRSQLKQTIDDNNGHSLQQVQGIFERWEGTVVSTEVDEIEMSDSDNLANDFEQAEDALSLKMMLDELVDQNNSEDKQ